MGVLMAPVWGALPQTGVASEFIAAALAYQVASGPLQVRADNRGVYLAHNSFPQSLSARKAYAGVVRDRLAYQEEASAQGDELRHVRGNALADAAAKEAVGKLHPQCDPDWCIEAEASVEHAWAVLQLIGWLAAEWRRPPKVVARRAPEEAVSSACDAAAPPAQLAAEARPEARCHSTHLLWRAQGGVLFCGRCGAFTAGGKVVSLAWPCKGRPSLGGAAARLGRLASGRPLSGDGPMQAPELA